MAPAPLAAVGCAFTPGAGTLRHRLRFAHEGRAFATIEGDVTIDRVDVAEDGAQAFVVVDDGRIRLAAHVVPRDLRFGQRPDRPPLFGWLEVRGATIARAARGRATMAVELPPRFEPLAPVVVELPCDELTPLRAPGDEGIGTEQVRAGVRVPLSVSPGGPAVGHLVGPAPRAPDPRGGIEASAIQNLFTLEEQSNRAKVRLVGAQSAVVGWVDASALEGQAYGMLGILGVPREPSHPRAICSREVPLEVVGERARVRVGSLRANVAVPAERLDDGGLAVVFPDPFAALLRFEPGPHDDPLPLRLVPEDPSDCRIADE